MADHETSTREQGSIALDRDRRAYVRVPTDLAATAGTGHEPAWPGRVRDISQGGIGLLLQHRFAPGTILMIDLRENNGTVLRTVRARVVHATATLDDGNPCWLLGGVFEPPLDEATFASLR